MVQSIKRLFKSNYLFTLGVIICLAWIAAAILAPALAPYDPIVQDLGQRLKAPSSEHWFGTDNFGRDIFSRVLYGGRYSLLAGCLTVVIAGFIGTFYGAVAGYVGGWVDNVMMRFSEMILSFPSLILAMIINAVMGSNLFNTMFALIVVAWPTYARMMRSVVLSVKENEYVAASEVLGASRIRILMKEVIPNSISSVLIMATTDIGNQILMFSTLSFLGLGSAPPTPEWGMMVSDGADYFNKFWVAGFPDESVELVQLDIDNLLLTTAGRFFGRQRVFRSFLRRLFCPLCDWRLHNSGAFVSRFSRNGGLWSFLFPSGGLVLCLLPDGSLFRGGILCRSSFFLVRRGFCLRLLWRSAPAFGRLHRFVRLFLYGFLRL